MKLSRGAIIGGVLGGCIAAGMMSPPFNTWMDSAWFGIIHFPALLFYAAWSALPLPALGEIGMAMIPVSVILQWACMGYLAELMLRVCKKGGGKGTSGKGPDQSPRKPLHY